jgi:pimeloyl-ACP methyl ester carboxylesterase
VNAGRQFFLVNGIRSKTGDHAAWIRRADRWIDNSPGPDKAGFYDYYTLAIDRWRTFGRHVKTMGEILLGHCKGPREVVAVGHSNGAALLCAALEKFPEIKLTNLHLIAGAVDPRCDKNGLNEALETGRVGFLHIWGSDNDCVLRMARNWRWLLGYGDMGRVGPMGLSADAARCTLRVWNNKFDHSTWFEPMHFEDTMQRIVRGA